MANSKIASMTEDTAPANANVVWVQSSDGTTSDRKVTVNNLLKANRAPTSNRRTSGNITANSSTWANVDTGLDITLSNLATGDWVALSLLAIVEFVTDKWMFFDVATIVSAAVVNTVSTNGAESGTSEGVPNWYITAAPTNFYVSVGGDVKYQVQAGDLSSGSVTFRLRYRQSTAANRTIKATSAAPLIFQAQKVA